MIYGDLELGNFDEEISGINLSKLFSVYAPQSAEGKRKKSGNKINSKVGVHRSSNHEVISFRTQAKKAINPHVIPMNYNESAPGQPATVKAPSSNKDATSPSGREVSDPAVIVRGSDQRSCPNEDTKNRGI